MPKFEVTKGNKESAPDKWGMEKELKQLVENYAHGIDKKPEWCVYGTGRDGGKGVLYWIRPSEEAEFVAHQIARLETKLGGHATAEKTEYNPDQKGAPIYQKRGQPNFILGNE